VRLLGEHTLPDHEHGVFSIDELEGFLDKGKFPETLYIYGIKIFGNMLRGGSSFVKRVMKSIRRLPKLFLFTTSYMMTGQFNEKGF